MIYATVIHMQRRFQRQNLQMITAQRTDDGEPDDSLIQDALNDAGALIDSYISARYTLPLTVVPPTLARQCCVLAWYYLCDQRATEQATLNYKDALKWLADVRDGKIPLGVDETGTAPVTEDLAQIVSEAAVFTRSQKGFL